MNLALVRSLAATSLENIELHRRRVNALNVYPVPDGDTGTNLTLTMQGIVAALLGTFIGNPLTYPLFWYSTYEAGNLMLGKEAEAHPIDLSDGIFKMSVDQLWPILKPMSLGSIPIGFGVAVLSYFVVKVMVEAYQRRRREHRAREESEALGTQ